MNITNCKVEVNFIDKTALEDSTITVPDGTTVSTSLPLLKNRNDFNRQFVISSYNSAILDGNSTIYPVRNNPYVTKSRSGSNRLLNNREYSITYTMTSPHTSSGLTFHFLDGYASEVLIKWYVGNTLLDEKTFFPDSFVYYCQNYVENYNKVIVQFMKSEYPFQHVSLNYIDFGFVETFEGEKLMSASVTEEIDATLSTIPINTFTFKIHDENGDFNPQNDNGTWRAIQKWQEVKVIEELNGQPIDIGTFYIDNWTWADNAVTFNCVSQISFLDNHKFSYTTWGAEYAGDVVDTILQQAEYYEPFDIASDIADIEINGSFDCTCREALQQVCLCIGAVCDTSRGNRIRIYKPDRNMDSIIGVDRKFFGKSSNELTDEAKNVSITYSNNDTETTVVSTKSNPSGKPIEYSGLTIYSSELQNVCDELLDYYSLRQRANIEYICGEEKVGEWVGIQDSTNRDKIAVTRISKQTIDLTGGFLAKAECVGYSTLTNEIIEMGNDELIMGDNVL